MSSVRFVLGDQLSRSISALEDIDISTDTVLMVEVSDEATYVRHHKQKLVLVFAAMRHFARSLRAEGIQVDYVQLDDRENTGSFGGELVRALKRHDCDRVVTTRAGEWRVHRMMEDWQRTLDVPLEIREDSRFLCTLDEFEEWASGRKSLRMEYFYRIMRRKTGWLIDDGQPHGGRWNYDADNRKSLPSGITLPARKMFEPDELTREVITLVETRFDSHFGELEHFGWAVRREDALIALEHFIEDCLPRFGDFQDAMKSGDSFLFHALLSPSLNLGLLEPREVCEVALDAYQKERAPLSAVEGFIRQVLGWREFIRGVYWLKMPDYQRGNFLGAERPLPDFFWTAKTDLNCLREAVESTRQRAYAHHIQRLMVIGNYALLAGLAPAAVEEWYLLVYADAYEWVELPNTHGMALFADGGLLASKPYAASGAYINRMSDYCADCRYNPSLKRGDDACPYNFLYWHFLHRNEETLGKNSRMALALRNLHRMPGTELRAVLDQAEAYLRADSN